MISARVLFFSIHCMLAAMAGFAQEVTIENYSVDENGKVNLLINSSIDKYYLLQVKHHPDSGFSVNSAICFGQNGTTLISESLGAYPVNHYRILEYVIDAPVDIDTDGINDVIEMQSSGAPLNAAVEIPLEHGAVILNTFDAYHSVSVEENGTPWVSYLDHVEYTKFIILDFYTNEPKLFFINSNTYNLHEDFANYLGIDNMAPSVEKGQILYNPSVLSNNGTLGCFAFNFSNNETKDFEVIQRTHELLAANMPFLENNLSYFITANNETDYQNNISLFQNSRVPVLFETDVYAGIDYWGLNQTEGYGYFRLLMPGEIPDSKDIVLCESIPNSLPRVGGIISSFIQTPLSHVNLRAIHDHVPNAFIRDPLLIDTIANLLNHYIYFKAGQSTYEIREASIEEVNAWYENMRPSTEQIPPLNLTHQAILSLDEIHFHMHDGYGAKTANLATMHTFGFVDGTVPDGFGIPFYFYFEFMKYNGFFEQIQILLSDEDFLTNRDYRAARLAEFQDAIRSADMPSWMYDQFTALQNQFPPGYAIRCRSSTNNEDLPGFSGAGLYDSKTHQPDEGHISKTILEVYASLWNLRAFEAREFYRVNHFYTAMGILCHLNFEDERVNGVGVSADPIYNTTSTFYFNSQLSDVLITNPEGAYPEELLMKHDTASANNYLVIQYSGLLSVDSLLMTPAQLFQLHAYLTVIHNQFAVLYRAEGNPSFAMDIEYKIDAENNLVIKQARPWVSYVPVEFETPEPEDCSFKLFPVPAIDYLHIDCLACDSITIQISDLAGRIVSEQSVYLASDGIVHIDLQSLNPGIYVAHAISNNSICSGVQFVKL
ncbi:MAG: hypothetical protein IPM74_08095 [Crocinitomicaceae bacterium]|nr:hypothetical protein [Crocinitomicaceae bacterium]